MFVEENILNIKNNDNLEEEVITVKADTFNYPKDRANHLPLEMEKAKKMPVKPEEGKGGWVETQKAEDFPPFLVTEIRRMRQPHSCVGNKSEMERSLGQHKRLNSYISKALQSDYDGKLNTKDIDTLRKKIEDNIDQLEHMLFSLDKLKKQKKQMRRAEQQENMIKEGGTPTVNYYTTPFQRAIVSSIINGKVSGGRDLNELYEKVKEKYKIDDREELAIFQILSDMGYPTFKDRLRIGEKNQDPREGLGEWQKQYYA